MSIDRRALLGIVGAVLGSSLLPRAVERTFDPCARSDWWPFLESFAFEPFLLDMVAGNIGPREWSSRFDVHLLAADIKLPSLHEFRRANDVAQCRPAMNELGRKHLEFSSPGIARHDVVFPFVPGGFDLLGLLVALESHPWLFISAPVRCVTTGSDLTFAFDRDRSILQFES